MKEIKDFKTWLDENHSNNLVKLYRDYVDDITDGAIIKAKKMVHSGESIDDVISYYYKLGFNFKNVELSDYLIAKQDRLINELRSNQTEEDEEKTVTEITQIQNLKHQSSFRQNNNILKENEES